MSEARTILDKALMTVMGWQSSPTCPEDWVKLIVDEEHDKRFFRILRPLDASTFTLADSFRLESKWVLQRAKSKSPEIWGQEGHRWELTQIATGDSMMELASLCADLED